MEKLGYEKECEWVENRLDPENTDPRFPKVAEMLKARGYYDLADKYSASYIIKHYAKEFFACYNKAYAERDNFGPVDERGMKNMIQTFAVLINTSPPLPVITRPKRRTDLISKNLAYRTIASPK